MTIKDLKEFIAKNELPDDTPITIDAEANTVAVESLGSDEGFGWTHLVLIGNED